MSDYKGTTTVQIDHPMFMKTSTRVEDFSNGRTIQAYMKVDRQVLPRPENATTRAVLTLHHGTWADNEQREEIPDPNERMQGQNKVEGVFNSTGALSPRGKEYEFMYEFKGVVIHAPGNFVYKVQTYIVIHDKEFVIEPVGVSGDIAVKDIKAGPVPQQQAQKKA